MKIVVPLVKSSELKLHDVAEVQSSVEPELEPELLHPLQPDPVKGNKA